MFAEALSFVLLAIVVFQQYWFYRERNSLLNMLAARDWNEYYKGSSNKPPPKSRGTLKFQKSGHEGDEGGE